MKNIFFFTIIFTLSLYSCKSNYTRIGDKNANYIPYYLKVYEADSLNLVGEYKRSNEILDSLFKRYEPLKLSFYNEYFTYLRNKLVLNDFEDIDLVLKKAVQDYGLDIEYCVNDSLTKIALSKAKFTKQDLDGFYKTYVKNLNLEYRYAIEKMIENDQRVRLAVPRDNEEWKKVDKENAENIKLLIEKYGYPSTKKIGPRFFNDKSANVDILFLHATKEAREEYILDLLLESVKKGECEPEDFAVVYDKYLYVSGEHDGKVLYGELRDRKKSLELVLINPKKIDSIRKSIGLENIEYKDWKIKKITEKNIVD